MSLGRRAYDLLRGYVNREWDRIHGIEEANARRELEESLDPGAGEKPPVVGGEGPANPKAFARNILGVKEDASFAEIRKAFERLSRRSAPSNFAPETPEARQAAEILKKVNWAYKQLTEEMNSVEKRFASLEIEEPETK